MKSVMQSIEDVRKNLLEGVAVSLTPRDILRSPDIKALYSQLPSLAPEKRSEFGKAVNDLKVEVEAAIEAREAELDSAEVVPLDVTAPWDVNTTDVSLLPTEQGT